MKYLKLFEQFISEAKELGPDQKADHVVKYLWSKVAALEKEVAIEAWDTMYEWIETLDISTDQRAAIPGHIAKSKKSLTRELRDVKKKLKTLEPYYKELKVQDVGSVKEYLNNMALYREVYMQRSVATARYDITRFLAERRDFNDYALTDKYSDELDVAYDKVNSFNPNGKFYGVRKSMVAQLEEYFGVQDQGLTIDGKIVDIEYAIRKIKKRGLPSAKPFQDGIKVQGVMSDVRKLDFTKEYETITVELTWSPTLGIHKKDEEGKVWKYTGTDQSFSVFYGMLGGINLGEYADAWKYTKVDTRIIK